MAMKTAVDNHVTLPVCADRSNSGSSEGGGGGGITAPLPRTPFGNAPGPICIFASLQDLRAHLLPQQPQLQINPLLVITIVIIVPCACVTP